MYTSSVLIDKELDKNTKVNTGDIIYDYFNSKLEYMDESEIRKKINSYIKIKDTD